MDGNWISIVEEIIVVKPKTIVKAIKKVKIPDNKYVTDKHLVISLSWQDIRIK